MNPTGFFRFDAGKRHGITVMAVLAMLGIFITPYEIIGGAVVLGCFIGFLYLMWLNYGDYLESEVQQEVADVVTLETEPSDTAA